MKAKVLLNNLMSARVTLTTVLALTVVANVFIYADVAEAGTVTDGLVSYWTFNEGDIDDDIVMDVWGDNHGTIMGKPKMVEGKVGECLEFNGIDDSVRVENVPSMNFGEGDFSVEAWIQLNAWLAEQEYNIIGKAASQEGSPGWQLEGSTWGTPGQKSCFIFANTASGDWDANAFEHANFSYDIDQWHHVVFTRSGGMVKQYVDGAFVVEEENNAFSTNVDNDVNLDIGGRGPAGAPIPWEGLIDEVRIYNRVLDEDEVKQNFVAEGLAVTGSAEKLALTWGGIKVSR